MYVARTHRECPPLQGDASLVHIIANYVAIGFGILDEGLAVLVVYPTLCCSILRFMLH